MAGRLTGNQMFALLIMGTILFSGFFIVVANDTVMTVKITSTDNKKVQYLEYHSGNAFKEQSFVPRSLPMVWRTFFWEVRRVLYFEETWIENGTGWTYIHGPFTVSLTNWKNHSTMIPLHYQNVTVEVY
jgi:hypothetical protein